MGQYILRDVAPSHWRFGIKQCCRATFPRYRDSVKDLLGKKMNALARKFHETRDMNVKNELERLLKEYEKLKQPWVFVSKTQKEI